jgi:hypothetical protein
MCVQCGFPAVATGIDIEATSICPAGTEAAPCNSKPGMLVRCPACSNHTAVPTKFGFPVSLFRCGACGVALTSNALPLFCITFAIAIPLIVLSYQRWPTFTFFVGDWLIILGVGIATFAFHRAKVVHG